MKKNNLKPIYILFLVASSLVFSCKKEEVPPTTNNTTTNNNTSTTKSIEVTVKHVYMGSTDSLLHNAKVDVYLSNTDRNSTSNVEFSSNTDKNGKCSFSNISAGNYYFLISKDTLKPAFEDISISENTTKGFVEAFLY